MLTGKVAYQPRYVDRHRTRRRVWWMSYCAKHCTDLKATTVPRKAYDPTSHRHVTLPFNDFLKVSIISFQAATLLNSGCPFFTHLLLTVA